MTSKKIYLDLDGQKLNILKDWRTNPLSTPDRIALGATLSILNTGLPVYDITQQILYMWNGSIWVISGGAPIPPTWGSIIGDINTQADLQAEFATKADISSIPPATDVQIFTPGTHTYTKPVGAKYIEIELYSGGGAGSSGGVQAPGVGAPGGNGGSGGARGFIGVHAGLVGNTETVICGAGGIGGAAITTNSTVGIVGTSGGDSSFGTHLFIKGGQAPTTATTSIQGAAGIPFPNPSVWTSGINGTVVTAGNATAPAAAQIAGAAGGGAGGSINTANTTFLSAAGANCGNPAAAVSGQPARVGGSTGTAGSGVSGGNGVTGGLNQASFGGSGGGGGACSIIANAGNGGDGGFPGGGAGGGGGARNGFTSGKGGNGGDGIVIVVTYF